MVQGIWDSEPKHKLEQNDREKKALHPIDVNEIIAIVRLK